MPSNEQYLYQVEARSKFSELCTQNIGALYLPNGLVEINNRTKKSAKYGVSLRDRTHLRLRHREIQRQMNLERILSMVLDRCTEQVSIKSIDQDWAAMFFNFALDVGDLYMQTLWACAIQRELKNPGSVSKCSLKFLHSLDIWEVRAFRKVAVSAFLCKSGHPFLFRNGQFTSTQDRIFFEDRMLSHCVSAGLIRETLQPLENGFEFNYRHENQIVNTYASGTSTHNGFCTQRFTKIGSDIYHILIDSSQDSRDEVQSEIWKTLTDFIDLKKAF